MNSENFRTAMRQAGLDYAGPIHADGELRRIKVEGDKARDSWYVLHDAPAAGAFGSWRRGFKESWSEKSPKDYTAAEFREVQQRWKQADEAEYVWHQQAQKTAAWIVNRAAHARADHPYLKRKGVKPYGQLLEYRGALVLPLRDSKAELRSLQFIDANGGKRFLPGGQVAGCFFALADNDHVPLIIAEGFATAATIRAATGIASIAALHCGNLLPVAEAMRAKWPEREIIVAADSDAWTDKNPGLTAATAAAKAIRAGLAAPNFKGTSSKPTDFNDLAASEGLAAVKKQIGSATVPTETDADTYTRLAPLAPAEYDRCREQEAKALGVRVSTLDAEVEKLRGGTGGNMQGCAVKIPEIEPWAEAVEGARTLAAVAAATARYVALPSGAADTMALWAAHTHCFQAFDMSPRLNIRSPEKGCGKTTLSDVIALFVPRSVQTENQTPAVLFRLIEKHKPVVLADEYDSWLRENEELRGLLNAGHRRGGKALRCEGDNHEVRAFNVFAPVVLCGIGTLPGTLHDRSIGIVLTRAKPGEVAARFSSRRVAAEKDLCRKLARWAADNFKRLAACDPQLPDGAYNRLADNWRPLFAIAEIAGGDWPRRAAAAFTALVSRADMEAQGIGALLLSDIAGVFQEAGTDKLPSATVAERLTNIEGRPWAEFGRVAKPITPNQLAKLLRPFKISPKAMRIGDDTHRGYLLTDFKDAFNRFLPDTCLAKCNSVTNVVVTGTYNDSEPQHENGVLHFENPALPPENQRVTTECYGVTVGKPPFPEKDDALLL